MSNIQANIALNPEGNICVVSLEIRKPYIPVCFLILAICVVIYRKRSLLYKDGLFNTGFDCRSKLFIILICIADALSEYIVHTVLLVIILETINIVRFLIYSCCFFINIFDLLLSGVNTNRIGVT